LFCIISRLKGESTPKNKKAACSNSRVKKECFEEDDVLCVLGLSELASQKLLQRIRAASAFSKTVSRPFNLGVTTAMATSALTAPNTLTVAIVTMVTDVSRNLVYGIIAARQHLISHQSKQLQTVVNFLNNTLFIDKAKSAKAVWRLGGGDKNLSWTFTVMAAFVLLLVQPLIVARATTSTFVRDAALSALA
jgi:hypothetical protein